MATESVMMVWLKNNKFNLLDSTDEGLSPKVLILHDLHNAFGCRPSMGAQKDTLLTVCY